jgi:hypothetical protein
MNAIVRPGCLTKAVRRMSSNCSYIYVYLDPRKPGSYEYDGLGISFNYEPFYVGQGQGSRYKRHLNPSQLEAGNNNIKSGKLLHIIDEGYDPLDYVEIICSELTQEEANRLEYRVITVIGRINTNTGPLANLTDGGDGMTGHMSRLRGKTYEEIHGQVKAAELKRQKRDRFLGSRNPRFGKPGSFSGHRISDKNRTLLRQLRSVRVVQMALDGTDIREWESILQAGKDIGVAPTAIGNCLAGRSKTCAGYKWRYA